jgi:hypothetical protein
MSDLTNDLYFIESEQEWEADLFRPEDAVRVRELFLTVYGEGYPIKTYLDPERLRAANADGTIISCVARTSRGDIAGHLALYQSAPCKKIYEIGAGLVYRNYRGKGILNTLTPHGIKEGVRKYNLEAVFGEAVCNHVTSQRMLQNIGAIPCAIEVDLMPAATYAQEKSSMGRVTSMTGFLTVTPMPHVIYLPAIYEEPMRYIYAGLDDVRDLRLSREEIKTETPTQMDVEYFDLGAFSRMTVWHTGRDFEQIFEDRERELLSRGAAVLQVSLNLSEPWVASPVKFLRRRGYFFCGVLPRWLDSDAVLMTKIIHRTRWEDIKILSDRAKKILEFVRADWEALNFK